MRLDGRDIKPFGSVCGNATGAQAFYRKWDFREVGEHVFQLGADWQTDILMEREL